MKFLFDVFPVLLFFIAFKLGEMFPDSALHTLQSLLNPIAPHYAASAALAPILLATALSILASLLQFFYFFLARKKIDAMLWVSFFIILVFGCATLYFHDERFIKWKPSVFYWINASALLFTNQLFNKNLVRSLMEKQITLPDLIWTRLLWSWILFFATMGGLNILVALSCSTSFWASFKLASAIIIMPAFIVLQSVYLSKYAEESSQ